MEPILSHDQIMNVLLTEPTCNRLWMLYVIYASLYPLIREQLWNYIARFGNLVHIMWVIVGDCNQPMEGEDKIGGQPINSFRATQLRVVLDACCMMDLGFQGPKFTWTNGRHGVLGNELIEYGAMWIGKIVSRTLRSVIYC